MKPIRLLLGALGWLWRCNLVLMAFPWVNCRALALEVLRLQRAGRLVALRDRRGHLHYAVDLGWGVVDFVHGPGWRWRGRLFVGELRGPIPLPASGPGALARRLRIAAPEPPRVAALERWPR